MVLVYTVHPRRPDILDLTSLVRKASIEHSFFRYLSETSVNIGDPCMDIAGMEMA